MAQKESELSRRDHPGDPEAKVHLETEIASIVGTLADTNEMSEAS